MAKKKKATTNPARGFATISIASKTKSQAPEESNTPKDAISVKTSSSTANDETVPSELTPKPREEVNQPTPEFEERLERDELQLLVEKYGTKVRRDSSRQISKCETDLRLLRGQALRIPDDALPEELVLQIIEEARKEKPRRPRSDDELQSLNAAEEAAVNRLWTLQLTLIGLGFSLERAREALTAVTATNAIVEDSGSVWGLNESLDFLAKELGDTELPAYDLRPRKLKAPQATSAQDAPESLRQQSPSRELSLPLRNGDRHRSHEPTADETTEEDIEVSDVDSDLEPEGLIAAFVETKAKLYHICPDLADGPDHSKARKQGHSITSPNPHSMATRKLQEKLRRIGLDPLFDSTKAEEQWLMKRIGLLIQAAQERYRARLAAERRHKELAMAEDTPSACNESGTGEANGESLGCFEEDSTDDGGMLGAMFDAPQEDTPMQPSEQLSEDTQMRLRHFGKSGGLPPRRVLEEACRLRDSDVRLKYTIVSPTQYVCRQSVDIAWTIPQPKINVPLPSYLRLDQEESSLKKDHISSLTCTMIRVAAPDAQQSEAYVATAALFCLFGKSITEGKSYMKLSPIWREVYQEFEAHEKENIDAADRETIKSLRALIEEQDKQQDEDAVLTPTAEDRMNGQSPSTVNSNTVDPRTKGQNRGQLNYSQLRYMWHLMSTSKSFQEMLPSRQQLPIAQFKQTALATLDRHQVMILCGETGCGKSTQLPAYILEHQLSHGKDCKIYCTEPRRISAITLAERVSEELGAKKGDVGTSRSLVGYAIRLESKLAPDTRLIYATVGVVLRMLESSKDLAEVTHLIIDEVHERSIDTDFLLIVLKMLLIRRPNLKVVLMSATVDATRFSKYLNNAPIVTVPGRTFRVQTFFLEDVIEMTRYAGTTDNRSKFEDDDDYERKTNSVGDLQGYSIKTKNFLQDYDEYQIDHELIIRLMQELITEPEFKSFSKAILVFLPGIAEIRELHDMLVGHLSFAQTKVYPLHSSIASEDQQEAFVVLPPGVRKIVLATNIAETGITIPDITCVIDCGRHREMRFDEKRQISRLTQSFISRANAKQRRGRAGRVQEGLCFHLFTKYRHDEIMVDQQTPEMLRLSLQDLVMRVKTCKLGDIKDTLAQALDPPTSKNIQRSIDALIEVGALTPRQNLTELGSQLAKLPLDAVLGKLCLLSAIFSCLDVGLTIAAILSSKSPFVTPFGARQQADQARLAFAKGDSDLLTAYNAYSAWKKVSQSRDQSIFVFCRKHFLSHQNLTAIEDIKGQLLSAMTDTGLVPADTFNRRQPFRGRNFVEIPAELNSNAEIAVITSSVIAWSFYPKLLARDGNGWRNISNNQILTLHPASVNKTNTTTRYLSYYSIMQSSSKNLNALSTTAAQELLLLLLAGDAEFKLHAGVVAIDGNRLRFSVKDWKTAVALKVLRERMEEIVRARLASPKKEVGERLRLWMGLFERLCSPQVEDGRRV